MMKFTTPKSMAIIIFPDILFSKTIVPFIMWWETVKYSLATRSIIDSFINTPRLIFAIVLAMSDRRRGVARVFIPYSTEEIRRNATELDDVVDQWRHSQHAAIVTGHGPSTSLGHPAVNGGGISVCLTLQLGTDSRWIGGRANSQVFRTIFTGSKYN